MALYLCSNECSSLSVSPDAGKQRGCGDMEPRSCSLLSHKHSLSHLMVLGGSFIAVVDLFLPVGIQITKKREGFDYWLICIPYIIQYVHSPEIFKAFF